MKIQFIKFKDNVRIPERKHYNDTGADIYMPYSGTIPPHSVQVCPLGFGIDLPDGLNAYIQERTSIAKQGIHVHHCAIDAGYKGEIHMIVGNPTDKEFVYNEGDRIGYLVIHPVIYADYVDDLGDKRGDGAFGSTGK